MDDDEFFKIHEKLEDARPTDLFLHIFPRLTGEQKERTTEEKSARIAEEVWDKIIELVRDQCREQAELDYEDDRKRCV